MNLRNTIVTALYEIASAITQFADAISPADDEAWRNRRWKQELRRRAILDSYEVPDFCPYRERTGKPCPVCDDNPDELCPHGNRPGNQGYCEQCAWDEYKRYRAERNDY